MSTNYRGRIFSNFVSLGIVQGTNFLIPIIIMPFVIRKIGADGFGMVAVAQVLMVYLATISDYGFNLTATRRITLHREDRKANSQLFFTVLVTKLLITVILFALLIVAIVLLSPSKEKQLLYGLGFAYVIGQTTMVSWFFQGVEKMQYITISTLIARLVFVVFVFLFIQQPSDHVLFLFFLGMGNLLAGLLSIYLAIRLYRLQFYWPQWKEILFELKDGWQITASNLSINTYLYINVFILRLFTNDLIVGYYSIAEKIFFAVRQVLGIFSQAIYPRVCQLVLQGKAAITSFFKEIYLPFLLLVAGGCVVFFIFAPQIIQVFLGEHAALPVLLLRLLSFVPIIVCLNIPAYLLLLAYDRKKSYFRVLTLGTLVNLAANLLLVNWWGATGTVISIIITELFITLGLNLAFIKNNLADNIKPGTV